MASNTKLLVAGKIHDSHVPATDISDTFRDTCGEYVFPQNLVWKNGEQITTIVFWQMFYLIDKNCFT